MSKSIFEIFSANIKKKSIKEKEPKNLFNKINDFLDNDNNNNHLNSVNLSSFKFKNKNNVKGTKIPNFEQIIPIQSLVPEVIMPRSFYTDNPVCLAKKLIGKILVRETNEGIIKCRIVETEAYCGIEDKASHAYAGRKTNRTQ